MHWAGINICGAPNAELAACQRRLYTQCGFLNVLVFCT